jgi:hypothetical protein
MLGSLIAIDRFRRFKESQIQTNNVLHDLA